MNAFAAQLYRDVTCATAAALITLVISLSFVRSTSTAPFHVTPATAQAQSVHQQAERA
jgi:hypothetical protein